MWLGKTQVHSPAAYGGLCLLRHGYLPAAFRIGHPLLFPLPPALLVPRQSIPHSLILQLGTPSATSHKCVDTGIPFSPHHSLTRGPLFRHASTRRRHSARCPCRFTLCRLRSIAYPPKKSIQLQAVPYYSRVHGTLLNSIAFSRSTLPDTRHWEGLRLLYKSK